LAIGYACLTIGVPNTGLSRCTLKNATEDNLRKITEANLLALEAMVDYNIRNEIKLFRISSDIIPFGSHEINKLNWWEDYKEIFQRIGKKITDCGIQVSMHPGQYTVLNASEPRILKNAIEDLNYHCRFLDALGMGNTSKLVLHIGGVYGDKIKASKAFVKNFSKLPDEIKNRLIIENDERNYNIGEVLSISEETGTPVVFDNLHHEINPPTEERHEIQWIEICKKTWKDEDGAQKIHYSQQKAGGVSGSHSDTIFINEFLEFYKSLPDKKVNVMLEVKDKNLSAIKCIKTAVNDASAKFLEEEWARYKYFVLSRSAGLYCKSRELLEEKNAHVSKEFYGLVEQASIHKEDKGAEINAAQHVWGYINTNSSGSEKKRYEKLVEAYRNNTGTVKAVKNHMLKCAQNQKIEYLINSLYFYI